MEVIGEDAFRNCKELISVVIPSSVKRIFGGAFAGCSTLTSLVISEGVAQIGGNNNWNESYSTFNGCSSLTSVVIPEGVNALGPKAFSDCTSLKEVTLPSTITWVGNALFSNCTNLKAIYCHVTDPTQIEMERGVELGGHQATLYVPAGKGVVAAYKKKAVWKKFAAIKPMEE